ncbi:MAG: hypothetical protein WBA39_26050 [Rivularia sp. (in: cyanobacteria)]
MSPELIPPCSQPVFWKIAGGYLCLGDGEMGRWGRWGDGGDGGRGRWGDGGRGRWGSGEKYSRFNSFL